MVEDRIMEASSPTLTRRIKSIEDHDDVLGSTGLMANNAKDQFPFQINGDSGLHGIEDKDVYTSVTKSVSKQDSFEATKFTSPYQFTDWKDSVDEKLKHNVDDGCVIDCRHPQLADFDKEGDHGSVKDIWVDEGVPSQNRNCPGPGRGVSLNLDKYQACDSEDMPAAELTSFKNSSRRANTTDSLDFESLLDQVEANNGAIGTSSGITNTTFLNELMIMENNPFLEDLPFEASQIDEGQTVKDVHPANPFDSGLKSNEAEEHNVLSDSSNLMLPVINIFLENSSFKAVKDNVTEATKISANGTTVEEKNHREPASPGEENKSPNDTTGQDAGLNPGASESKKVSEHSDSPVNLEKIQLDPLESSPAAVNSSPASITNSAQIPYSGSISHRSDCSATSNRSFAFPVLQTEWNTSPVKMAKANRRQLRKHSGWRHTLLCCKF